nr:immunoglobulin heavy chain junction region [Macaca mulatta]
CARVQSYFDFW